MTKSVGQTSLPSSRRTERGNTVESVWSLLNRAVIGSYHKISTKHIDAYLDELEWRFNNRKNPYLFRETMRKPLSAEVLPYKRLVKKSA